MITGFRVLSIKIIVIYCDNWINEGIDYIYGLV